MSILDSRLVFLAIFRNFGSNEMKCRIREFSLSFEFLLEFLKDFALVMASIYIFYLRFAFFLVLFEMFYSLFRPKILN